MHAAGPARMERSSSGINSWHALQTKCCRTRANLPGLRETRPQFVHRTSMLSIDIMSLRATDGQHQRDQSRTVVKRRRPASRERMVRSIGCSTS